MLPEIEKPLAELDRRKADLIAAARALPARPADPQNWSPVQVIAHMAVVERAQLDHIARTAEQGADGKRPTRSPLLSLFVAIMRAGIPIPAGPGMEPPAEVAWDDAVRAWDTARADLKRWLEAVADGSRETLLVHPQAGALSALQVLAILDSHTVYHQKRLK